LKFKEVELLPLYLQYYHRFSHPGINRKTNYALYQRYADTMLRKEYVPQKSPRKKVKEEPIKDEDVL
jgi:hypothetical protein